MKTTLFVFVLIMVMPDGEPKNMIKYVPECPPNELVEKLYNPLMKSGDILDWSAVCLRAHLKGLKEKHNAGYGESS